MCVYVSIYTYKGCLEKIGTRFNSKPIADKRAILIVELFKIRYEIILY